MDLKSSADRLSPALDLETNPVEVFLLSTAEPCRYRKRPQEWVKCANKACGPTTGTLGLPPSQMPFTEAETTLAMNRICYEPLAGAGISAPEKTGRVGGVQELHPGPHEEGEEEVGISADGAENVVGPGATTAGGPAVAKGIVGEVVFRQGRQEDVRQPNIPTAGIDRTVRRRRCFIVLPPAAHFTGGE